MTPGLEALPWRGPGPGRPDDLRLPPERRLRLRKAGTLRKRWRYLGAFADEFLLCAARVKVGPLMQTFWALYDRREDRLLEQTVTPLPGARGEVWSEDGRGRRSPFSRTDGGTLTRIEATHPEAGDVRASCVPVRGVWVESVCPNGADGVRLDPQGAIVPVTCDIRIGEQRLEIEATRDRGRVGGLSPPPHGLELVCRRWPADRRSLGRLEPRGGPQRPARALGARDLGGGRALRAGAG